MTENADPMSALRRLGKAEQLPQTYTVPGPDGRVSVYPPAETRHYYRYIVGEEDVAAIDAALRVSLAPETPDLTTQRLEDEMAVLRGFTADDYAETDRDAEVPGYSETGDTIAHYRDCPGGNECRCAAPSLEGARPEAGEPERLTLQGWSLDFDAIDRWLVLTDPDGASMIVAKDVDLEYGGDIAGHWRIAERLTATPAALTEMREDDNGA